MHPDQVSQLARLYIAESQQAAAARSLAAATRSRSGRPGRLGRPDRPCGRSRPSVRNRAGWVLVGIGLRLAGGSAD